MRPIFDTSRLPRGMRGAWRHKGGWRVSAVATAAIAAIAVPLFAASSAGATRSEFYGVVQTATLDNQDAQGLLASRVRTNRFVLKWGWVEPNANSFDWDSADSFIGGLAFYGIRTVPSLWGNPDWVPGSGSTPPIGGATGENAWRVFLRAMAGRYGPGGTYWQGPYHQDFGANATPLPIQSWQIWNEPNLKKFFAPYPSPGKYAHLLQISRDALRSKDPKAEDRDGRDARRTATSTPGTSCGTSTRSRTSRTSSMPLRFTPTPPRSARCSRTSRSSAP